MSASSEDTKAIVSRVEEAVTYPILTREVDSDLGTNANVPAVNGGSLNRVAQQTLRDLLGWRYRSNDPAGFTAALSKAFTPKHIDGYVQWEWKQQSFSLQADLGAITGAQASIHAQARSTVDHVLPLLDALKPLRPDVDLEDTEAIRGITRSALQEIVNELAARSGPRVQRVDGYFKGLLGRKIASDAAHVRGYLGQLRDRFGLLSSRVNTVDEERNLTNFIVLVDQAISLAKSWDSKRSFFTRDTSSFREPFLGTQLVQLAEVLDVVVEQVHETYAGMDSVFFGAAERQTTLLPLEIANDGQPEVVHITVSELLGWIESFASSEGRQLLQNSGKDGVAAFRDTLEPIAQLLEAAFKLSKGGKTPKTRRIPSSFYTSRVTVLLEALSVHAESAVDLASRIQGPAQIPCWIKAWLGSEYCDAFYQIDRWRTPQKLDRDSRRHVEVDIKGETILRAALDLLTEPETGGPPMHESVEADYPIDPRCRPTKICFDVSKFDTGRRYDLVYVTDANRVVYIPEAVEIHPTLVDSHSASGAGSPSLTDAAR